MCHADQRRCDRLKKNPNRILWLGHWDDFLSPLSISTAYIQRLTEGNVFTLSTTGVGNPHLGNRGYVIWLTGGCTQSSQWGYPVKLTGGIPSSQHGGGFTGHIRKGVPPIKTGWGTLKLGQDGDISLSVGWGYQPPEWGTFPPPPIGWIDECPLGDRAA